MFILTNNKKRLLQLVHLMNRMLDLVNGATRIEVLGASVSAVHDSVAAIELVGVIQTLQTLLGHLVS